MRWRLVAVLVGFTAIVLLVQTIPLASYLRTVERDRLVTSLEREAFTIAGASTEVLEQPDPQPSPALTAKEFDVLAYLADDPGAVRRRTEILEHVWEGHWYGATKTVDAHVAAIRKKLGDAGWIEAVRGVGFRLGSP